MTFFLKIAVLLVALAGTSASDYPCTIAEEGLLDCDRKGLSMPPPGYWPQITTLTLTNNQITELPKNSLSGFPSLTFLDLDDNSITEIDFGEIATIPGLSRLFANNNQIHTFKPPPNGTILEKLEDIDALVNRISHLDPDFFSFAPNLRFLDISASPIVVEPGKPILNHAKLEHFYVGMGTTSFKDVDSTLFSGLPNLTDVVLNSAGITSLNGAFVNNKRLKYVDLLYNGITEITAGTFADEGRIEYLFLQSNPLRRLDTAALNKAMAAGGLLNIIDTPLACNCAYEAIFWWSQTKNIRIYDDCNGQSKCAFTTRR